MEKALLDYYNTFITNSCPGIDIVYTKVTISPPPSKPIRSKNHIRKSKYVSSHENNGLRRNLQGSSVTTVHHTSQQNNCFRRNPQGSCVTTVHYVAEGTCGRQCPKKPRIPINVVNSANMDFADPLGGLGPGQDP
eukprot:3809451-Ditylum_brightwellii.AAC.1